MIQSIVVTTEVTTEVTTMDFLKKNIPTFASETRWGVPGSSLNIIKTCKDGRKDH